MNPTETQSASSFLGRIRECTTPLHQALESNSLLSSLTSPALTIHKYQVYLSIMIRVATYYETEIQQGAAGLLTGWKPRKASALMMKDLANVEVISGEIITVPKFTLPAHKLSDCSALGFIYVMEGSKLGGRVIYKQVKRHIGLDEEHGAKYLADYGADTLASWKVFLHCFSSYIVECNGEEQAITGANLAFLSIADFFESNNDLYAF